MRNCTCTWSGHVLGHVAFAPVRVLVLQLITGTSTSASIIVLVDTLALTLVVSIKEIQLSHRVI